MLCLGRPPPSRTQAVGHVMQLKNPPDFTKVPVNAPAYKEQGSHSDEQQQKQVQATEVYSEVNFHSCFKFAADSLNFGVQSSMRLIRLCLSLPGLKAR